MIQTLSNSRNRADNLYFNGQLISICEHQMYEYLAYSLGEVNNLSLEKLQEMKTLDILTKLGFPLTEVGTFLYKDMIMKAIKYLDGIDGYGNPISPGELREQMKSPYSQFYMEVARHDSDLGIKTFHTYIENALATVDYGKADATLLCEIFGDFSKETDYGEHAFIIGQHIKNGTKQKNDNKAYVKVSDYNVVASQKVSV